VDAVADPAQLNSWRRSAAPFSLLENCTESGSISIGRAASAGRAHPGALTVRRGSSDPWHAMLTRCRFRLAGSHDERHIFTPLGTVSGDVRLVLERVA